MAVVVLMLGANACSDGYDEDGADAVVEAREAAEEAREAGAQAKAMAEDAAMEAELVSQTSP